MKFTTHFELHSQTTRLIEGVSHGLDHGSHTGFSPSMTPCSKGLRPAPHPKHPLQITTRALEGPDFKFELLPLHSPLLRQSLLVSFPPLIDMLKFSGYPYLIRGQSWRVWGVLARPIDSFQRGISLLRAKSSGTATAFQTREPLPIKEGPRKSNTKLRLRGVMTLEQACPPEYRGAQCAFKDSMIH